MTIPSKDEIVKMAREAGLWVTGFPTEHIEHFATLCRAPLIAENAALKQAHEINADTLNARQVEIDDWKARAAAAEAELAREGEAVAKVVLTKTLGLPTMQWLGLDKQFDLADGQLLYTTPPQPAAQEPPSAVPVVEQLLSALMYHRDQTRPINTTTEAIAAGQQYLKENGK